LKPANKKQNYWIISPWSFYQSPHIFSTICNHCFPFQQGKMATTSSIQWSWFNNVTSLCCYKFWYRGGVKGSLLL
jgi:hypothetical protein